MATIPTTIAPDVRCVDGHAVTSSLAVSEFFGKRHDNVIAKIANLDCSPEFRLLNFKESVYHKPNPSGGSPIAYPSYTITRDGFTFLAMGFTGKRAAAWKEAYINAFNAMESQLAATALPAGIRHLDLLKFNSEGLVSTLFVLRDEWDNKLYPLLKIGESPLAVQLHDRVHDAVFLACLIQAGLKK